MRLLSALFVLSLLAFGQASVAANYKFDKTHTQIFFTVSHLGLSHSTGKFLKFDGGFNFDESDIAASAVSITIESDSIDLDNRLWDAEMKNPRWLDAENHPEIAFQSRSVTPTGDKTFDINGDLTIKGVTKPVVLKAVYNGTGKSFGKAKIGFDASTKINRKDFGITAFTSSVGVDVEIRMTVEGFKQK